MGVLSLPGLFVAMGLFGKILCLSVGGICDGVTLCGLELV
jgi:hypothetical protein